MNELLPLDLILGHETAARVRRDLAADLAVADGLEPDLALRLVCERATDGDPLLLAAPGQIWSLRPHAHPDDGHGPHLLIHSRLAGPPRLRVSCLDDPGARAFEMPLEGLAHYRLDIWHPVDVPAGGTR